MVTVILLFLAGITIIGIYQKIWSDEVYQERMERETRLLYLKEERERTEIYMKGVRIVEEE